MTGYFDHNATTPLSEAARNAWLSAQSGAWQNPSGLYRDAGMVKRRIEEAREVFGGILGCDPRRIVFTSGATEGCNAVMAHEAGRSLPGACALTSAIEHPAVAEAARKHFGSARVGELEVNASGILDLERARRMIESAKPTLVSVMAANNETGVLQPWRELAEFCRERGVRFHCDAAQWVGKLPADDFGGCDWVTVSGHKFGGPKGVGLLIIPGDISQALALQAGGPQESGHRGGTESYADIAAMLAALQCPGEPCDPAARDMFEHALTAALPGSRVIGAAAPRLMNTSMVVMPKYPNLKWLTRLDERGFAVSTGSACSAGRGNPSRTLAAMGLDFSEMGRVIRFSAGPATTLEQWMALAAALEETWKTLLRGERNLTKINLSQL